MVEFETILWGFNGMLILGIVIFFTVRYFISRQKIEIPENAPEVINYWTSETGGYTRGVEIEKIDGKNGRKIVSFVPKVKEIKDFKVYKFVLQRGARIRMPEERTNTYRLEYYPPKLSELDKDIIRTEKGNYAMDYLTKLDENNTEVKYMDEGLSRIKEIMMKRPLGEATATELAMLQKVMQIEKKIEEEKKEAKTHGI